MATMKTIMTAMVVVTWDEDGADDENGGDDEDGGDDDDGDDSDSDDGGRRHRQC